ncbi:MAG: flippase [Oscillospiraceae bacterium]
MGKSKVLKNYIYNTAYQILVLIAPLITAPYVSRILGASGIGIYSYAQSIVTYFILFGTVGSSLYGQREIAYCQDKPEERSRIFYEIIFLRFITVFISTVIYFFVFAEGEEYRTVYRILIIDLIASAFDITWLFQGMENFKKIVIRNAIVKLLSICSIFIFVRESSDIAIYTACLSLPTLIANLSLWFYLPQYLVKIKFSIKNIKKHLLPIFMLFIPQIAMEIYTVMDKTMIGIFAISVAEVGYYTQSQKIVKIVLQIVTSLGTVMLPAMAAIFASGDKERVINTISKAFKTMFFIGFPMMFGLMGITENMVPWFFGNGFQPVVILMVLASPMLVVVGISNVIGMQYLLPTNKQNVFTISVVTGAVVNFILNIILIPKCNSLGATIATLIAEIVVSLVQIYVVRKDLPITKIFKQSVRYLIMGVIMGLAVYAVGIPFGATIIGTLVQIIIGVLVYIAELIIIKDSFFFEIVGIVKNKIK